MSYWWDTTYYETFAIDIYLMTSLVAQIIKHLPTMQETRVQPLGREDLLEKEMATHSSILVWKIPWTEEPGRLQSVGSQRVEHDWATSLTHSLKFNIKTEYLRDFPLGLVVKTSPSKVQGAGLIPGWGAKILHALWPTIPKHKTEAIVS